jgi:2-polyprenyl-6-methoxyphenol hydroxylase-like FAD-dependent oxidoreductase
MFISMSVPLDHRRRRDVIIIGGRVAGASTALLLARGGLRVFVVERARRGSDTVSTHALMRGGVLQLHRWGLLDRVVGTGAPPVRRVTFHYGHDSMPVTLKPYAGVDALYAPRRTVLDALLVGAAEEAGARFGFGLAMTDVARDRAGRVVGVVVRDHLGATWTERAGLVVAADGRSSLVATLVGAPTVVAGVHAAAYVYGYWPAADLDGYHWYYGDGLSAGVIPTNDGLACVFAAGPAAVLAARMRHSRPLDAERELLARIDCRLTDLTRGRPLGPVRFFRGLPARLRRPHGPGWALVGDAGWWKDPLSTYGITDAFRDAELLAEAVVAGAESDRATQIALRRYQAERDRLALSMHPIVDRLASHQWDLAQVQQLLRELASVMADDVEGIRAFGPAPGVDPIHRDHSDVEADINRFDGVPASTA